MTPSPSLYRTLTFYLLAAASFLLDQFTKLAIVTAVAFGHSKPLIDGWLHLTHTRNFGASFSIFWGHAGALAVVASVAVVAIALYQRLARPTHPAMVLGLGLLMGGAAGNLADRLFLGYVRDMIDVRVWGQNIWPIFNVADISVFLGVGALMLYTALEPKPDAKKAAG